MKRVVTMIAGLAASWAAVAAGVGAEGGKVAAQVRESRAIGLPPPATKGRVSLEEALVRRRSVREFSADPMPKEVLSQLLWAAQGVTGRGGLRTAPSAGALYPLELYVATAEGLFHYDPRGHQLVRHAPGDARPELRRAALDQASVGEAPAVFVIAAEPARTESKYGRARTPRYVDMEAGHAAQNLLLQAAALGWAGVPVGAFDDARVRRILALPAGQDPLYLVPVGKPR